MRKQKSGALTSFLAALALAVALFVAGFVNGARGEDAPKPVAHPAIGVIVVAINKIPQIAIFLNAVGEYAMISYDACSHDEACAAVFMDLVRKNKFDVVNIVSTSAAPKPDIQS